MNKNEVKNLKNSLSSNTGSNILNEINTKNISYQKDVSTNKNNTPKNKSISSNHIFVPFEEDKKSKHSNSKNSKKGKEKNDLHKIKKKSKDRIANLLKNKEKLKIPSGKKRRSFAVAGNNLKLLFNNCNNSLSKSLTPPKEKETNIRADRNGIKIIKNNKKFYHITFLDMIPPNNKFTETIFIQSYKKYNIVENLPGEENLNNCSKCCNIY